MPQYEHQGGAHGDFFSTSRQECVLDHHQLFKWCEMQLVSKVVDLSSLKRYHEVTTKPHGLILSGATLHICCQNAFLLPCGMVRI